MAVRFEGSTRLAVFLFTDIAGSSTAWDRDAAAMAAALEDHDALLSAAIAAEGGRVFKHTGDGLAATFETPAAAARAAVAGQRALASHRWSRGLELSVRMGLHMGEATLRDDDCFGPAVNRAARIVDLAPPGQVVGSAAVVEGARGALPADVLILDEGWFDLVDHAEPVHLCRIVVDGVTAAEPDRRDRARGQRRLEAPAKPLVGRDAEVGRLEALLDECRLVTLVGTGGVGKTHLALHVAASRAATGPAPTWWCDLTQVRDATSVGAAVLSTLRAPQQPDAGPIESVVRFLGPRRGLLVLDDCEHVLDTTRELCRRVLARCPNVVLLATSRRRLGVASEQILGIEPLDRADAVGVFVGHAAALGVDLSGHEQAVGRVCERLDRIPLAVELASSRTAVLSLEDLERLLDDRLRLLATPSPEVDHHRTLEAAIAWSYEGLTETQRRTFDRLGVLAGPFDLEAAVAVAGDDDDDGDVVARLLELCERSLVVADLDVPGPGRYRMLESIRIFAEERLGARPEERAEVEGRHVDHFVHRAERNVPDELETLDERLSALSDDWDDLRAAFELASRRDDRAAMLRIIRAVSIRAELTQEFEVVGWCERALVTPAGRTTPGPLVPDATLVRDGLATWSRLLAHRSDLTEARALAREAAAHGSAASVSIAWFWSDWVRGDFEGARRAAGRLRDQTAGTGTIYEVAQLALRSYLAAVGHGDADDRLARLEVLAAGGSPTVAAFLTLCRALEGWSDRDREETLRLLEQARRAAEQPGLRILAGGATAARSIVLAHDDDTARSARLLTEGLRRYVGAGMWTNIVADLLVAARVLARRGDAETAARLLGAREGSNFRGGVSQVLVQEIVAEVREVLGERFDDLVDGGRDLDPPAAARVAVAALDRTR